MRIASRRGTLVFFLVFGVSLAAVATAVGFGWIILNWQQGLKLFLGVVFFGAITTGLVLNTTFLVREIRRNEQHDSWTLAFRILYVVGWILGVTGLVLEGGETEKVVEQMSEL